MKPFTTCADQKSMEAGSSRRFKELSNIGIPEREKVEPLKGRTPVRASK